MKCSFSLTLWLSTIVAAHAHATTQRQWITSWYGSPIEAIQQESRSSCKLTPVSNQNLPPAYYVIQQFENATFRTVVRLSAGGDRLRVRISNAYGCHPLTVGGLQVIASGESRRATFNRQLRAVVAPRTSIVSDPVDLSTPDAAKIEIRVFYPEPIPQGITFSVTAEGSALIAGDALLTTTPQETTTQLPAYFLTSVDVERTSTRGAIVAIGDSITAGGGTRWPALLAQRLSKVGKSYAVINAGIGGNRLLRDSPARNHVGVSVSDRFQTDVLDQASVKYVILFAGINDLGWAQTSLDDSKPPTLAEITAATCKLSERAHRRGLIFYAATLPPFEGASIRGYYTPEKNQLRHALNAWIRESRCIDGNVDFERALSNPENANQFHPDFDSGDHLHPNDAGQRAMSDAIDLALFR